ncbi:MAG: isoprenyl transferase [Mucinivorans sp.]
MSDKIPRHIAIIMDGNGRWAKAQGEERLVGHHHGVDSVRAVVRRASDLGVEYLTIYAFSQENWGRPQSEVDGIMELLSATIMVEAESLSRNGVKIHFIGDTNSMPESVQQSLKVAANLPMERVRLNLVIALNYSARWEITLAMQTLAQKVQQGILLPEQIDESMVSKNLTTKDFPDPDMLIRTSGECRLSNFLLWQLSYTELYFVPTLWPDFGGDELEAAVVEYGHRSRRFGRV